MVGAAYERCAVIVGLPAQGIIRGVTCATVVFSCGLGHSRSHDRPVAGKGSGFLRGSLLGGSLGEEDAGSGGRKVWNLPWFLGD